MALSSDLKLHLPDQKDQCCKVVLNTFYQRQHPNQVKAQERTKQPVLGVSWLAPLHHPKGERQREEYTPDNWFQWKRPGQRGNQGKQTKAT